MDLSSAHELIWKAMLDHKLFDLGWSFEWSNEKTVFGRCKFGPKIIVMSKVLIEVNDEAEVCDTILHEIAHALVGPSHDHDFMWKLKAQQIGAKPVACSMAAQPPGKWVARCAGCGAEIQRYRRPKHFATPGAYSHKPCKRAGKPSDIEWTKKY